MRKTTKIWVRIIGNSTEIRIEHSHIQVRRITASANLLAENNEHTKLSSYFTDQ
jgi:hypothetical protein